MRHRRGRLCHPEGVSQQSNITGHGATLKSWVAAAVILAGFIVGGIAIIYWNWPIFWVGVGIAIVGCIIGWAVGIMEDVTEYGGHDTGGATSTQ